VCLTELSKNGTRRLYGLRERNFIVFMWSIAKLWPKKREESMPGWDFL